MDDEKIVSKIKKIRTRTKKFVYLIYINEGLSQKDINLIKVGLLEEK